MEIDRMNKGSWGSIKAYFDLKTNDGFLLKGFRLVAQKDDPDKLFVGFPSQRNNEGEYFDTVLADEVTKGAVNKKAIAKYNEDNSSNIP